MKSSIKNFLIGIFLIAGLGVFVSLVLFLRPRVGDEKQTLFVRFSTINKINVGTRVLFAGKAVGEVTKINEIYHARETQPSDGLGRLYFYQLTLKIDSNVHVYSTDEVSIQTSGLMGEKSIAIIPKTPPKGVIPEMITDKTPFYADSIDPIENTITRLSAIGDKLDETAGMVKTWFEQNEASLSHAISSFGAAMTQIDTATRTLNEEQLIPKLSEGATAITSSMQKVDDALACMTKDGVFENFGTVVANLKTASNSFDSICKDLADGQGTIGKLLHNDDIYMRMTALMSKADTMMNDVNHYGILFHLNKGWQRTRTKQLNAMNALSSPDSFKDYFQTEIDQINTTMARLSMLIDKAQQDNSAVLDTPKFRENFVELLRKVKEMSDNLHLYNEQLAEAGK
jgi:phospholipid/cholesterol/gamma-HCH transport system substrate-binding protein